MKDWTAWGRSALVGVAATVVALAPARAANCTCYYDSDCGAGQYCNWQDACTRHCELQGTWDPAWGAPPQSTPQCDNWIGACHDNEPSPAEGTDGDGQNCDPPTAANPGGGDAFDFKMRDGVCNSKKIRVGPPVPHQDASQVDRATGDLLDLVRLGGGEVQLDVDPYVRDLMHNLAILAVGLYDFQSNAHGNPILSDLRGDPCAEEAISTLGHALAGEIRARGRGEPSRELDEAEMFATLSPVCATWMETRPHNCQFPHPHQHHFDYENGLECIASNIRSMASSLFPVPPSLGR